MSSRRCVENGIEGIAKWDGEAKQDIFYWVAGFQRLPWSWDYEAGLPKLELEASDLSAADAGQWDEIIGTEWPYWMPMDDESEEIISEDTIREIIPVVEGPTLADAKRSQREQVFDSFDLHLIRFLSTLPSKEAKILFVSTLIPALSSTIEECR